MDHRRILPCLGVSLAFTLTGCQTQPAADDDGAPSAALEDLEDPQAQPEVDQGPSLAELARQSADDMAKLMEMQQRSRSADNQSPPTSGEPRPWQQRSVEDDARTTAAPPEPTRVEPAGPVTVDDEPPPDPVELMLAQLEEQAKDPDRAFAATLLAGAIREYAEQHDGGRPGQRLSPTERDLADALGPLLRAMAAGDRADAPRRIAQAIDDVGRRLPDVLPVRINDAALATDIYGFAAYRPFERYAFMAGRSNRMLLYTEPASFQTQLAAEPASRGEASNPGVYEVVLGLELRLYNERGSMLAWRKPEERVVIRSDRPRQEIYLGTVIDLPASLSVGRYQLKVIVRDKADGSEDERVIPIEIVADPRLTSQSTRSR
ncbi:MAG: hypothetical protein RIE32_08555 [Phycisphaerales bacterium]